MGWPDAYGAPWVRPVAPAGTGSGNIAYTVDPNPWNSPRKSAFTVGGSVFTLTQDASTAAGACTPAGAITPSIPINASLTASSCYSIWINTGSNYYAKRYTFSGMAGAEYAINLKGISSFSPYLNVMNPDGSRVGYGIYWDANRRLPTSGFYKLTQTGTYIIEVSSANPITSSSGATGDFQLLLEPRCDVTLSATAVGLGPTGTTGSVPFTSSGACTWAAYSLNTVLTNTGASSGSGNGTASFSLPASSGTGAQVYAMLIGGQWLNISRSNTSNVIAFTPTSVGLSGAAQSNLTSGISASNYTPYPTQPWLTFGNFPSSTTFYYSVQANTTGAARSAQLVLGDASFTVNQAAPAGLTISGKITQGATALPGVAVSLSGSIAAATTTNATGDYVFAGLTSGGNYNVTPTRQDLSFAPSFASYLGLAANQTANFTGIAPITASLGRSTLTFTATGIDHDRIGDFGLPWRLRLRRSCVFERLSTRDALLNH